MDANEAGSVSSNVGTELPQNAGASSRSITGLFRLVTEHKAITIVAVVLLIIIAVGISVGQRLYMANKAASPVASRFNDQKIPLDSAVGPGALQLNTSQALSINGQLRANNTLVLAPSNQPTKGTAGQLYYDSATSRILYHNGQTFVAVADTTQTDQLQAQLQTAVSQEEVASLAAQIQALQSELGQVQVPANVAQLNTVNNFSAQNTFAAGLTAASLSVSGATALGSTTASSLILSNPLGVSSGGTGQVSLPLNGVLIGQGTNPVVAATASSAGQCLISTAGAPVFQPCPGGSGGVDSLNGLSGALTLANASAAGSTIVINDASTSSKGIASFNAANFSVSGGTVNTIQDISTTAAPVFNGLTVTNNLTAGTLSGDGTNVTNVNASQLGGQVATFYLNASNIFSGTLSDARLSTNVAQYNAPTANFTGTLQQGGNNVCTTAGNCVGTGGAVGGSGTPGTIAVWDGSGFTLTDSLLSQAGGVVTTTGDLTVSGDVTATNLQGNGAAITNVNAAQLNGQTAAYYLNATNIASGTLNDARLSSNVTLQGNIFNGAGQLVQLNASSQLPAVSGALLTGLNASSISSGMLSDARLSSNVALLNTAANFTGGSLQFNGSDVCTMTGNCAGVGGGVTTPGGTAGTIAVFDGAGFSIIDSLVSQSGATVTISGGLVATSLAGNGAAVTNVNAAQLNGQGAAYYLDATNINAGTLNDARLSANVTLQGNTFNGANQLVQLNAVGALPALDGSNLMNVNAALLGGQNGAYYLDLTNATGTLNDARLSNNVALFNTPTANFTGTLQQGGNNVCTTAGNCVGSGAVGGSGTPGTIAVWNGSGFTLTDSLLSESLGVVTVSGDLAADNLQGNGAGVTNVNAVQLNGQTAAYYLNASNVSAGTLADARLSANVTLQGNIFNGAGQLVQLNASSQLPAVSGALLTDLDADQISSGTLSDARLSSNVALYNAATANFTGTLQQGGNNVCTTAGNCASAGGGVTTPGGTAGQLAVFSGAQTIVDSIISDNGSTVTIGGTLAVNTITPTAAMTVGSTTQALTLQGNGSTQLSVTSGGITNSLSFATPSGTNKNIVIPNASGTVAVSASGPLSIDANGNISCATCTTSGGGSGGAVDSLNGLNGALNLANASGSGSTITIDDASTTAKGIASFNSSNFTVSAGAVNTVQNISVTAAPSFAGLTLTGDLALGANSIVTSGATIDSTELNVLDGGIDEMEVTGVITDVTAGTGLTGGGASGNATLNVVSANGGIVVTPDNIALTLQPSGDGLSTTTSSGSGLEILAGGITLLQGCSDGQVLKWNETTDTWGCAADAGGTGVGDDILVNGSNANGANFLDTASSGTSTGVLWGLNTTPTPNEVTITIANASATQAGSVTTGVQSFAGDKTFNNALIVSGALDVGGDATFNGGLSTFNTDVTIGSTYTFTINGDTLTDLTGTGLAVSGTALQTTLGTTIDSSEIVDGTIVGTDIAAATIANSNLVNSSLTVTAGNGLTNGGAVSLGGSTTLNIASANSGIAVNADNIALTLQPTGDALSSTTSSGSGLEILAGGLSLLQGCSDSQVLKWNETTDMWGCAADAGGTGVGDDVSVNGSNASGANFLNTVATGSSAGVTWNLNTTPTPNEITLAVSNASATEAGVVTTGVQSFSGAKTFGGQIVANGGISLGTQTLQGTTAIIDFTNFDVAANGNTTIGGTLTVSQAATFNDSVTVAAGKSITLNGGVTGTRPSSPTEGMIYFDTTTKQLLTYANGKWQADRTTATKIVAASNSSQAAKDSADYVATGANDHTTINSAITALSASGGVVYLIEGTYVLGGSVTISNSNVKLTGAGSSTVLTIPNAFNTTFNMVSMAGGTNVVENVTLDQNNTNQTSGTVTGIHSSGSSNTVQTTKHINVSGTAILMGAGSEATSGMVRSNRIDCTNGSPSASSSATGISIAGSMGGNLSTTTAQDNTLNNCGTGLVAQSRVIVADNTVSAARTTGMSLQSIDGATITGNNVTTLSGNFSNNYGGNVLLGNNISRSTISGNTFMYGQTVVNLTNITNSVFTGNTMSDSNGSMLFVTTGSGNTFANNTSRDSTENQNGWSFDVNNTIISGNKMSRLYLYSTGAYNQVLANQFDAIGVTITNILSVNGDNTTVADNVFHAVGSGYVALGVAASADATYLSDNRMVNSAGATFLSDAGTNTIYGGQINNSSNYVVQPAGTIELMKNTNITGTLNITGDVDTNGSLTVGNANQFIVSNLGVVTAGTWQGAAVTDTYVADTLTVNSSSNVDWQALNNYPAACAAGQAITQLGDSVTCTTFASGSGSGNYIQNQFASAQSASDFWISGTGRADTALQAPTFDTATASTLTLGGNATSINVIDSVTLAAGTSLTVTGGTTGTRPASPTEGMIYFDTTTKQLLVYANGKWQADRNEAVIVAASNSSQTDKDAADYVATGANDGATVNTALATLPASGGKVYLMKGTYTLGATSINMPNNTTLAGTGAATILTYPNAMANATYKAITNTDIVTGTHVNVRDIMIDGNRDNQTTGNFYGVYFDNMGSGTGSSAVDGGKVSNIVVKNMYGWGIYLTASSNNTISDNTAGRSNLYGISINASSNGNTITGNTTQYNNNAGIHLSASSNNTVAGNTAQGNNYGIFLQNSSTNTITGNTTQGGTNYGMRLDTSSNNTITGNTVRDNGFRGVYLNTSSNSNTVASNSFHDNGGATANDAIHLSASDSNNITGNTITDTSATTTNYAINISNSTSDTNHLSNNVLGTGTVNNAGTGTIFGGQENSGNYVIQPAGSIALTGDTFLTGSLDVTEAVVLYSTLTVDDTATLSAGFTSTYDSVIRATSTTAFQIQNSASSALLTADTTNMQLVVGNGGNTITLSPTNGFRLAGTARNSKTIRLFAEYPSAVLDPGGTGANTGTMTSGNSSADRRMSYYSWATTQVPAQSYDIVVQVPIPKDFDAWDGATPFAITGYTTDTTNGTVKIEVIKSNGSVDSNFSTFPAMTIGSNSTWTTNSFALDSTNYTAGDYLTLRIRLTTTNGVNVRSGNIVINYLSKF